MRDLRWPTYAPRNIVLDGAIPDASGRGSMRVRDVEGREYLDAVGGIGCLPLGHGHPRWRAAVETQMDKLVAAAGTFWTEPQQALAAELAERVPVSSPRVFFGNTGTEVTEGALKLAMRATGRDVVIGFERAFHGRTLGSIALTANPKYRESYVSCLNEPDDRFARMNVARAPFGDLEAVAGLVREYGSRIAMVVVEPIQGEGGIRPAAREFLVGLRRVCDDAGALLGLDEIQSGCGRTGRFTAWQTIVDDEALRPDVVWLAKALGGGYPIGACVARGDLAEHMTKGSHGSTFGGNPLACAAALATLKILDEEDLLASAAAQLPALEAIATRRPIAAVREVRGLGAMIGIELGDADLAGRTVPALQLEGLLVTQCGGTAVRLLLPYRAGEAELEQAWAAVGRALGKVA